MRSDLPVLTAVPAFSAVPAAAPFAVPAVYGVVLNHVCSLDGLGAQLAQPPYQAAPKGPVMYVKPRNTWVESGHQVALPQGEAAVEVGATLALVVGAAGEVAACQLVIDLSLPHASYYRPAIREKCFDDSCVLGLLHMPPPALDKLIIRSVINGRQVDEWRMTELVRPPAQLLADVTAFMTLNAGDRLLVGVKWQAPQAHAGDVVTVQADGLRSVQCRIVPQAHNKPHNGNGEQA